MEAYGSIYKDIATRTNGDIYIGVVGPVRTGKSTFIKRFMEEMVLPQMEEGAAKERAKDEMPQSGSGKNVMTTEPKFVPDEAVRIQLEQDFGFRVKLIDCVGFVVPEAQGLFEEGQDRMVNTPWSESPLPFREAAKLGTQKVISEHATLGIVVTTDGSICDLDRESYVEAEEEILREMKKSAKPFVVLLNSQYPQQEETKALAASLSEKYKVPVLCENLYNLKEDGIQRILQSMVLEFPTKSVTVKLPGWILSLPDEKSIKGEMVDMLTEEFLHLRKTGEVEDAIKRILEDDRFEAITPLSSDLGKGEIVLKVKTNEHLFWDILSEAGGQEIRSEEELMAEYQKLCRKRNHYEKISAALREVEENGYGIVTPTIDEMKLEEPEIVKQSGGYGVKLKASAPSIHLIRANIQAEISPIVGSERQSEDIAKYLLEEFKEDPAKIWQSNLFGKSLYELVNESLNTKLNHMPKEARTKIGETLQKVINEGSGGLICIIL